MSDEVAVVGPELFTLGFKLAGVRKTLSVEDPERLNEAVRLTLEDRNLAVLVMKSEDIARLDEGLRARLEEGIRPALVGIGLREETALRQKLKQAIGVDVWDQ